MGCICAKSDATKARLPSGVEASSPSRSNKTDSPGLRVDSEVYNILNDTQKFFIAVQGVEGVVTQKDQSSVQSLIKYPRQEDLLAKFWIEKRGHVIRTWKRRFCVLDKTDLSYYTEEAPTAPYGKHLKGSVALLGSVCVVKHDDPKTIHVEIYGNYGEKDLFFSVASSEEGQQFVRTLEWAIRKTTITMLVRNIKAQVSSRADSKLSKKKKKNADAQACTDWLAQQALLFASALETLKQTQLVQLVTFAEDGALMLQPSLIRLWSSHSESQLGPTSDPNYFGLAYQPLSRSDYLLIRHDALLVEEDARILTFDDIEDYTVQRLDASTSAALRDKASAFHHAACAPQRLLVLSLRTAFGHSVHLLACCLRGHQGFLLALQQVFLMIAQQKKCRDAAVTKTLDDITSKAAVVTAMKLLAS